MGEGNQAYNLELRFDLSEISHWASRYPSDADHEVEALSPGIKQRGYFIKDELLVFCSWNIPNSSFQVATNSADYIEAVTHTALSTSSERLRIDVLRSLKGVDWPNASVLLHFGHRETYPVFDYRSLWSVMITPIPSEIFDFWWSYTCFCRDLADQAAVSMRTLDRALRQYYTENWV